MTLLNRLCDVYTKFNKVNGLNLGSADEHLFDEDLTKEQRNWLQRFINTWEQVIDRERKEIDTKT